MNRSLVFFAIFFLSLMFGPSSWAGCPGDASLPDTPGRIRHLAHTAHTEEQFTTLANYYEVKRQIYARKALEQRHLWADRAEVISPVMEKWPRPVDSSRNLYEYYAQKAAKAAALSAKFTQMGDAVAAQPEPR